MAYVNTEALSAFLPIDYVGACPPEHVLVPAVGILLVFFLVKLPSRFISVYPKP